MKRWPVIPTILVALAVATMIGLGLWQLLDRRPKKLAYIEQLSANPAKPPITFPRFSDESLLFRRASGYCLEPNGIETRGAGAAGFRLIAECRTGAEGPGMSVQLGTTTYPNPQFTWRKGEVGIRTGAAGPESRTVWRGGEVQGYIAYKPDGRSAIGSLFNDDGAPRRIMLVLDRPVGQLAPNPRPDPSAVPNPHLSYAFQWFFFAGSAAVIYVLALRRRVRAQAPGSG